MNPQDYEALEFAVDLLEKPHLAIKIANKIGYPIEYAIAQLPMGLSRTISNSACAGVHKALQVVLTMLGSYDPDSGDPPPKAADRWHMAGAAMSGALGGVFGPWGLAFEIPLTTGIMMRSIAEVAQSEGANTDHLQTRIECVQVLGLGGQAEDYKGTETHYFVTRDAMTRPANKGADVLDAMDRIKRINYVKGEVAGAVGNLIESIATRFSIQVSEKAAAQIVPVIGAASGAAVNTFFTDHFQNIARGHFIVRRLEGKYGPDPVRREYQSIKVRMET